MKNYIPNLSSLLPMFLMIPTYTNVSGVFKKTFPNVDDVINASNSALFYGSFKTYGGTERDVNGIYSIEDTAIVETFFRPDIKSDCRIALENGEVYEIINTPEDIDKRHQFLKFKIKRIKGGA